MSTTILHLADTLVLGGRSRVMQSLARLTGKKDFNPVIACLEGSAGLLQTFQAEGIDSGIIGEDLRGLEELLAGNAPWVAIIHRSGEETPLWNRVLPRLRGRGARIIFEINHFGYPDNGPAAGAVDKIFCVSKNTLWRHWTFSGRPGLEAYLSRHRVLYNPVLLAPGGEELITRRARFRTALKLPESAFVLGSVYRPDPGRIDAILPEALPRLLKEVPELYFVTRRFPGALARRAEKLLGKHYRNLSLTFSPEEMVEFYAGLDALAHFSSMGESFGLAIAEAMRCGVPVITNATPSLSCGNAQAELVQDGVTGFLANDPATVVRGLKELAAAPEVRREMGAAARQRFCRPELNPRGIARQLTGEILTEAGKGGWEIALRKTPVAPAPSRKELEDFLLHSGGKEAPKPAACTLQEKIWAGIINLRRAWWRVRRRRMPRE